MMRRGRTPVPFGLRNNLRHKTVKSRESYSDLAEQEKLQGFIAACGEYDRPPSRECVRRRLLEHRIAPPLLHQRADTAACRVAPGVEFVKLRDDAPTLRLRVRARRGAGRRARRVLRARCGRAPCDLRQS